MCSACLLCPVGRAILGEWSKRIPLQYRLPQTRRGRLAHPLDAESHARRLGGLTVPVLGLAALIRTKEEAGRDKDRAVLELLRQALHGSTRTER
jgi:hypothetical protein